MKKTIRAFIIFLFIVLSTLLLWGIINRRNNRRVSADRISRLPCFTMSSLKSGQYSTSEIMEGPVLVVRFHPECEHCRYEISGIMNSTIPSSCARVLFITDADSGSAAKLFSKYDLKAYVTIRVLIDTSYIFEDIFGKSIVPSNYLYGKDLELSKVFFGEVKTETLLRYLNNIE